MARVIVVGGDNRFGEFTCDGVGIQVFQSSRNGGNGSVRRAKAIIAGGAVDLVLFLVKWLGHADWEAVTQTCITGGVPYLVIRGGRSATQRALASFLARRR